MNNLNSPLVSVCMITYNHEAFIKEAIEGVLMQKTTFPIELIIGEDCSTDNTRAIVKEYEDKYPSIITAQYPEANRGMMNNFITVLKSTHSKYIALCEGDDYWTDPLKLQKQVDFLEGNEEFAICFHNTKVIYEDNSKESFFSNTYFPIGDTSILDLAKENFISTLSCVFRNNLFNELPEWYSKCPIGDYPLHLLNAQFGKIRYFPDVMANYRVHKGGVWETKEVSYKMKKLIELLDLIKNHFSPEVNEILKNQQIRWCEELLKIYQDDKEQSSFHSKIIIENNPFYIFNLKNKQYELANQLRESYSFRIGNFLIKSILFLNPLNLIKTCINFLNFIYKKFNTLISILKLITYYIQEERVKFTRKFNIVKVQNEKWKDDLPLVSVVIPCFNYGKFVEEAIDSVLNQTLQNFEIIVIDGGSTDLTTLQKLKELKKAKTKIYYREGRHHVGSNRNYGIERATGKYICCLDADDMLVDTYLEKALYYLETYRYDVVYPSVQCFGESKIVWYAVPSSFERMVKVANYVSTVSVFSREAWGNCNGYKDWGIGEKYIFEDWDFWARLMGNGYRFKIIKEPLMLYRTHREGLTGVNKKSLEEHRLTIYNENKDLLEKRYRNQRNKNNGKLFKVINPNENLKLIKTKKRILLALPFMIIGGADTILLKIFKSFINDFDLTIITTLDAPPECGDNTVEFHKLTNEIYHLRRFLGNEAEMCDFVHYLIESRGIDLLFIVGCQFIYRMLPEIKHQHKDLKVVDQLFNEFGHINNNRKFKKYIDRNIVASHKLKNILIKKYSEVSEKIDVIIHGIDTDVEYNTETIDKKLLSNINIPDDKFIISYFGRMSEEKGPDIFVKIINQLKNLNIYVIMTGNGPEFLKTKSLVVKHNLQDIFFLPGFVEDVKPYIAKSDIVVLPSRIDGLPIVLLEALSFGIPVVVSDVGGMPEMIKNGINGFICPNGNIQQFAEKIGILYNKREMLQQMKKNSRDFAVDNISFSQMIRCYHTSINKTIHTEVHK